MVENVKHTCYDFNNLIHFKCHEEKLQGAMRRNDTYMKQACDASPKVTEADKPKIGFYFGGGAGRGIQTH